MTGFLSHLEDCPARYPRWCSDWPLWVSLGIVGAMAGLWWMSRRLPP
ncbi:MAG TPA: hypothetical protein PKW90_15230 [Myxococcota bacterium]|nr:hypothetical protein [Myxococcota bacterium]